MTCLRKDAPAESRVLLLGDGTWGVSGHDLTKAHCIPVARGEELGASPCHRQNTGPLCSGQSQGTAPKNQVWILFCC